MSLQSIGGSIGNAINTLMPYVGVGTPGLFGSSISLPETNFSESLESWGGSAPGSTFQWVPQAHAAEETGIQSGPASYQNQSNSGSYGTTPTGTTTQKTPVQQTTNNGGIPPVDMSKYQGWTDQNAINQDWANTWQSKSGTGTGGGGFDPNAQVRNEISSGWDSYINDLNRVYEGLTPQRQAQEGIASSQYNQGVNTLGLQKTQGVQALDAERQKLQSNQVKTLRDISGNLKNAFMAGNVYLGARGAGDSSAADQYALALTKEGSRQRGDVMAQTADQQQEINQRETNLNNIYNTEINNLEQIKNSKMGEIAQWFAEQQNAVRMAQANGQLSKSQDLASLSKGMLNQAISWMNDINSQVQNKRSALESWAMGVSKNIGELKNNMANISQFTPNLPSASPIAGTPQIDSQGNFRVQTAQTGYGNSSLSDEQKRLLGLA